MRIQSVLKSLFALGCAMGLWATPAAARSTIRNPGQRAPYRWELEPHLLFAPLDPPGWGLGEGFGLGFRASVEIVPRGFIRTINNSVAITFGADWVHYYLGERYYGRCSDWVDGPGGRVCVEVGGRANRDYFYFPIAMQWNFWLHRQWSVFGEPGVAPYINSGDLGFTPTFSAGGRFHFSNAGAVTCRLGYPSFSCGVSFFL